MLGADDGVEDGSQDARRITWWVDRNTPVLLGMCLVGQGDLMEIARARLAGILKGYMRGDTAN